MCYNTHTLHLTFCSGRFRLATRRREAAVLSPLAARKPTTNVRNRLVPLRFRGPDFIRSADLP